MLLFAAARRGAARVAGASLPTGRGAARCLHKGRPRAPGQPSRALIKPLSAPRPGAACRLTTCKRVSPVCPRHPSSRRVAAHPGKHRRRGAAPNCCPWAAPSMLPRCPRRRNNLTEARTAARYLVSFTWSRLCRARGRVRVLHGLQKLSPLTTLLRGCMQRKGR